MSIPASLERSNDVARFRVPTYKEVSILLLHPAHPLDLGTVRSVKKTRP
jgi:hypothetical protein